MPSTKPRQIPCVDCGQLVWKVPRPDRIVRCADCAALRIESAAVQMANKSGPVWDAWVASNADGAKRFRHPTQEE